MIKGPKTAEVGIAVLVAAADVAVANNTAALIVTADVAKEISQEYHVDPRRTASLMDIFCLRGTGTSAVWQPDPSDRRIGSRYSGTGTDSAVHVVHYAVRRFFNPVYLCSVCG